MSLSPQVLSALDILQPPQIDCFEEMYPSLPRSTALSLCSLTSLYRSLSLHSDLSTALSFCTLTSLYRSLSLSAL